MSVLVDDPIFNSPFEEPRPYWGYQEGQPVLAEGRHLAGVQGLDRTAFEKMRGIAPFPLKLGEHCRIAAKAIDF